MVSSISGLLGMNSTARINLDKSTLCLDKIRRDTTLDLSKKSDKG